MLHQLASKFLMLPLPAVDHGGNWRGSLILQGADDRAEFEGTAELLSYFARFAGTGAFSTGDGVGAGVVAIDVQRQRGLLLADIAASGLHPGAWRVLVQMLAHCHQMEPYIDFALHAQDKSDGWHTDQRLLLQTYPTLMAAPASLDLEIAEAALAGINVNLRLTSTRELASADVRAFGESVDDWGALVYTGGFTAIDHVIDEPLLNQPSTSRAGLGAIDVAVTELAASVDAWCSLVNLGLATAARFDFRRIELA